ncbi:MAG: hypothetical protein QW115_07260, partial [Thermoplasmata archaeon]
ADEKVGGVFVIVVGGWNSYIPEPRYTFTRVNHSSQCVFGSIAKCEIVLDTPALVGKDFGLLARKSFFSAQW